MSAFKPSPSDQVLRWACALTAALCGARPAFTHSPVVGGLGFLTLSGVALGVAPAGPSGALARVSLLVGGAIAGWGSAASFGVAEPWRAFFAQQPGQAPLLLLRLGLFVSLLLATEAQRSRTRVGWLGVAGALLVASLAFRILLLPYCLVALAALGWSARRTPVVPFAPDRVLSGGALVLALLSLLGPPAVRLGEEEPADPKAAIAWWLRRENPFQAHYRAAQWAKGEAVPADGYLALARLDVALGRRDRAHKVLAKLVARAASEEIRGQANALQTTLDRTTAAQGQR